MGYGYRVVQQMALRTDDRQWLIYDPHTVDMVFKALEASALVMFGAWMQRRAGTLPAEIASNVGRIGVVLSKIGAKRQQIQAGLTANDVPDELIEAQLGLNEFMLFLDNSSSADWERLVASLDEIAAAMTYLDERTSDTGTNHPRWNSRLVSGESCESCGR